jgi:sterol carrier protein 2
MPNLVFMAPTSRSPAYVLGVGLTRFVKPGGDVDYPALGYEAGIKALLDAHITYDAVQQGIACYVYGDSTAGQRVFYQFGMTQIPIYNVNNNCATGSTGLAMARDMVSYGMADCVMVVGFEKMFKGSLKEMWNDRASPIETSMKMMAETRGISNAPGAAQLFGNAGIEYMERYGASASEFAEIARINHLHSTQNPYSQFRTAYTLSEIQSSPLIHNPLTKLQCCPTSDGAAATIIVSEAFLQARPHLLSQAILIAGQSLATDSPALFSRSSLSLVGFDLTAHASRAAFAEANLSPSDINVCELHDCFSANELITLDALGLCPRGKAHEMVRAGEITFGGKCVVNPSGGLISKGHPLGATGLAQCAELVWQLRGWANNRLVDGARAALQHNIGLGGAVVVTVYTRPDGKPSTRVEDDEVAERSGVGYNPAVVAGGFSEAQAQSVRSQNSASEWAMGERELKIQAKF